MTFGWHFLGFQKISILPSTDNVTRFLFFWRFFVRHVYISSEIRNFSRYLKIFPTSFKRSQAAWEYRRDHMDDHNGGESAQLKKMFFPFSIPYASISCDILKRIKFYFEKQQSCVEVPEEQYGASY